MFADPDCLPDEPILSVSRAATNPVDIKVNDGDLYYVDVINGDIHRIRYFLANQPPTASISAVPTAGSLPLQVNFYGTVSTDPDGDALAYSWDFNGDRTYSD